MSKHSKNTPARKSPPRAQPYAIEPPALIAKNIPHGVSIGLTISLAILLLHIYWYRFLCDDAFISFRYARNFADGFGLVFNPGFERVEGYTNFLWVLILAGVHRLGIEVHDAANPLLILCGVLLWLLVVRHCLRITTISPWWTLLPAGMLALNRSFALWCTSGLETKLFELLCVAGVVRSIEEFESQQTKSVIASLLFALAALTRPDGLLIATCVLSMRWAIELLRNRRVVRSVLWNALVFTLPVAAHFVFRRVYYHDWLPNTYYAKVGGKSWWEMGWRYATMFATEYVLILWTPVLIVAIVWMVRKRKAATLTIILAAIVPHAIYVISIGGDHFEWRPLDLYFPLLLILMFYGFNAMAGGWGRAPAAAYAVLCTLGSLAIPTLSHIDFPPDYRPGFPGVPAYAWPHRELVNAKSHPLLFAIPGINSYLESFNQMASRLSVQFVGIRQEEHAHFLACSQAQGLLLCDLVKKGTLPADLHVATDCVGAIPYFSNLRTLDRLGLTDRVVAGQQSVGDENTRVMAHDKRAKMNYAREMGVDLWCGDSVYLVLPRGHPALLYNAQLAMRYNLEVVAADVGDGRYLLARAPLGEPMLEKRMPTLKFIGPPQIIDLETRDPFMPVPRSEQFAAPYDALYVGQAEELVRFELPDAARIQLDRAIATNPQNERAREILRKLQRVQGLVAPAK